MYLRINMPNRTLLAYGVRQRTQLKEKSQVQV